MPQETTTTPMKKPGLFGRFFALFGIRRDATKGQWLLLTRRFRIILVCTILALIGGFLFFTFSYSSRPEFCESCHFMKPYVDSWRASSHSTVQCSKCHFPPGLKGTFDGKLKGLTELIQTVVGQHGPLRAEIEDASCLREGCHEKRLLEGKVVFQGKYRFDHTPHLTTMRRGKNLRCTSCHSQIVQGEHLTVTEGVCFICHFKGQAHDRVLQPLAGCTRCHEPPSAPIQTTTGVTFNHQPLLDRGVACWRCHLDSVQGTADVPKQICLTCHHEPEKTEKYSDPALVHEWHVTKRKVECFQCHTEIRHGRQPAPVDLHDSCAACHATGHDVHTEMYAGKGGLGVPGEPSMHFRVNVDCVACHEAPGLKDGQHPGDVPSLTATEQSCVVCHGESKSGMLAEWKSIVSEMQAEAQSSLDEAQEAFDALGEDDGRRMKATEALAIARHNIEFVASAFGAHNPGYAMDLLDKASEQARAALKIVQESPEAAGPSISPTEGIE